MNQLAKTFHKQFVKCLFPLSFKSYKNFFFRIVNDIVQIIALKRSSYECTIEFAVNPLCFWSEASLSTFGGYNISMLRKGQMKGWDWRLQKSAIADELDSETRIVAFNNDVDWIIEDMLNIVKKELIPIFSKAITCEATLTELENYEKRTYGKILFLPISRSTYYLYIKIGEFNRAREYLHKLLTSFAGQSSNAHHEKEVNIRRQIQILKSKDIDYLNSMLKEKESAARNYFESL